MKLNTNRLAMALLFIASSFSLVQNAAANTPIFVYTNRDMLLCFRKTGAPGGTTSPNNLEVNIGQASTYSGAAPGSTITITQITAAQLAAVFDNLNDLSWSVGGCVPVGDAGDSSVPLKTLWVTAPRNIDPATPAAPWTRNGSSTQGLTSGKMNTILANASFYSGSVPADPTSNAPKVVAVPVGGHFEYGFYMGALGNYDNTFQGNVENTTSATFVSEGQPARSDLYELRPDGTGTQPSGKYLGYFELRPNGTMVFVAASTLPPAPMLSISVINGTNTISLATIVGATYTLYYTNSLGLSAPVATWPFVSTNIIGDGSSHSISVYSTDADRFYSIGAH
jgi:hypothetical protein